LFVTRNATGININIIIVVIHFPIVAELIVQDTTSNTSPTTLVARINWLSPEGIVMP